jgi:hypothetical protein
VADWVPPPSALKATRRRLKQALKGLVGKG